MTIKVKYEKGLFKPLQKIKLKSNQIYEIEVKKICKEDEDFFSAITVKEFFNGYSKKDEIYDDL